MAEELKRHDCPFCGENELVQPDTRSSYLGRYVETVECKCCGASAPEGKWNTRAQLPSQGGEAVEVVAHLVLGGLFHGGSGPELGDIDYQIEIGVAERLQLENVKTSEDVQLELMTVAQHRRILAAITHPANQVADGEEPAHSDASEQDKFEAWFTETYTAHKLSPKLNNCGIIGDGYVDSRVDLCYRGWLARALLNGGRS